MPKKDPDAKDPFVVLSEDREWCGSYATESLAIKNAKEESAYEGGTFFVAEIVGVAKPAAQPAIYTPFRRTPRDQAKATKR
jgi:hypothetical protein